MASLDKKFILAKRNDLKEVICWGIETIKGISTR